jgi:glycosyltransferase involved in cell wall biosynthesis
LKIVHVSETFVGGVQTYLRNVSEFLKQTAGDDTEVYIIYSGLKNLFDREASQEMFAGRATLIEIPMANSISPLQDIKATRLILRELNKIQPDVIHLHSSKAGILGRAAAFFYRGKKKVFYNPHGYAFLRTDVSSKSRAVFKMIEKGAQFFLGGTTIACGDTEYEIAKKFGRAELVRNGISIDALDTDCPEPNNKRLTIGIISRITAARSPELFNNIALRFPDIDFVWIGDGELRHELTAKNISITGWLTDAAIVSKHLCGLDVYMQTSLWEGLPYAVVEAMSKNKPVVATNVIGNKDVVVHGETGFLFTDIAELDGYFETLKNKDTRNNMGQKGYRRLVQEFNNATNFKHLLELYRQ